jgi:hypothetical protein
MDIIILFFALLNLIVGGFIIYTLINIAAIIQETANEIKKKIKEHSDNVTEATTKENKLWENLGKTLNKIIETL